MRMEMIDTIDPTHTHIYIYIYLIYIHTHILISPLPFSPVVHHRLLLMTLYHPPLCVRTCRRTVRCYRSHLHAHAMSLPW